MKKFDFRLEKVLQYRTLVKDEKLRELMLRNYELQQARQKLEQLEQAFLSNQLSSGQVLLASEFYLRGAYAARLKDEIATQKETIEKVQVKVQEAMEAYIEASKDQKALAMLKDKKRAEYMEWIDKELGKNLDEMSIQRAGYKRGKQSNMDVKE